MGRQELSRLTLKKLFALSGNQCAFSNCTQCLVDQNNNLIADVCHIEAAEEGGERFNPNQTDNKRAAFENLLVLCPTHHRITDDETVYTVDALKAMKANHEAKFRDRQYEASESVIENAIQQVKVLNMSITVNAPKIIATQGDVHYQQGISYGDVRQIFFDLFKNNWPQLQKAAQETAEKRVGEFVDEFTKQAKGKLSEVELNKFADPDLQYVMNQAIKSVARKDAPYSKTHLAVLLIKRIKNDAIELKSLVYNEAIDTISKLTKDQLDILTLCFLMFYSKNWKIISLRTFNEYLDTFMAPFKNYRDSRAQFQHIEFTGCGTMAITTRDALNVFMNSYPGIFNRSFSIEEADAFDFPQNVINEIFILDNSESRVYFQNFPKNELMDKVKGLVKEEVQQKFWDAISIGEMKEDASRELLENGTKSGKKLRELSASHIGHLQLTSVGIVIAATHYENTVQQQLNIDNWIN